MFRNVGRCLQNLIAKLSMYLLNAIGLTPGGSSTVHIYTQTVHRTTQFTTSVEGNGDHSMPRNVGSFLQTFDIFVNYNWVDTRWQ